VDLEPLETFLAKRLPGAEEEQTSDEIVSRRVNVGRVRVEPASIVDRVREVEGSILPFELDTEGMEVMVVS
jgi:hypothetical protein